MSVHRRRVGELRRAARSRRSRDRCAAPASPRRARARRRRAALASPAAARARRASSSPSPKLLPTVRARSSRSFCPRLGEREQQPLESRAARGESSRREVGAAEERHAVGREEHGERPAAVLALQLQRALIDLIDVGHLFAIDLHADEALVHEARRLRVLEGLVRHHVAPVTGGVADAEGGSACRRRLARGERLVGPNGYQSTGLSACWRR